MIKVGKEEKGRKDKEKVKDSKAFAIGVRDQVTNRRIAGINRSMINSSGRKSKSREIKEIKETKEKVFLRSFK